MPELTVIIPIRGIKNRNIEERLSYVTSDTLLDRSSVDFLVVDDGSLPKQKVLHELTCKRLGMKYTYIDSSHQSVNMARARNVGVALTDTKYVMFMDVDLFPYPGFYNDVLKEIKIQKLDENPKDLIMFSVIYLTQDKGVSLFFKTDEDERKSLFLQKLQENNSSVIEKFSSGTSVCVYHKNRYMELGGYDEDFCEWGYEDLEFNLRVMCSSKKLPIPEDFHLDYKSFQTINEYRGWKSLYKRYGEITFQREIVLFHIWHEVEKSSAYIEGYEKNRQRFVKKIATLCTESKKSDSHTSWYDLYRNSKLITALQSIKKIPLLGTFLIYVKQKVLQWK